MVEGEWKNNEVAGKMCVHLPTSVHHESPFEERSELNYTQQLAAIISYCFFKTSINASQTLLTYFLIFFAVFTFARNLLISLWSDAAFFSQEQENKQTFFIGGGKV